METLIIIIITMIFSLIFFNIINNKKLSIFSFFLFITICLFNYLKVKESNIFYKIFKMIENVELFMIITCIITLVISIVEYIISYRKDDSLINDNKIKNEEGINNKKEWDILMNLFNEPIAILLNDYYLLNKEMQKKLNYNNNTVSKNKFNNLIHSADRNNFLLNTDIINFRLNINGDYEWFESVYYKEQKNVYCLIRKNNSCNVNKVKTKSFKELFNIIHLYEKKKNYNYFLAFFGIKNHHELTSFYGDEYANKIIYKHIEDIINLSYVNEENIFLISKYEYVLLLDNNIEYNILLSELENNSSILLKNDIILSSNKIVVKGNVGAIDVSNVKDKDSNNILNKGLELLKLASDEDYSLDYAIFNEIDEEIEYSIKDIDIDLNFDFSKYKKRIQ